MHDSTNKVKEEMQNAQTWRELLGKIVQDAHERARITTELGVHPLTLARWVNGDASPHPQNLQALLRALPQYRPLFLELMPKEFGHILDEETFKEEPLPKIPSAFYGRIFHAHAELPDLLRSWTMCDLILQQALQQLDPNRVGMEISVMQCMSPSQEQKVYSLRETLGRGTPPWARELQQRTLFLGAESLAGYAVIMGQSVAIQTHAEGQSRFPARWVEREESAAAHPIRRAGRIAGCLLFSCTQPNYFLPFRLALIESYTELMVLAFEREAFYEVEQIELGIMPTIAEQQPYFAAFSRR